MLILDAKTFKEVARATIDADIHLDLHGYFIPQQGQHPPQEDTSVAR